jgi:hypothetical protein
MMSADYECVVALLGDGRAHGLTQLRALFTAQRALHDHVGACRTAASLLRAPGLSSAQTEAYRAFMSECAAGEH